MGKGLIMAVFDPKPLEYVAGSTSTPQFAPKPVGIESIPGISTADVLSYLLGKPGAAAGNVLAVDASGDDVEWVAP